MGGAWVDDGNIISLVASGATFGAGWVLGTGPKTPRIVRYPNKRVLYGVVTHSGSAPLNSVITLDAADRPPTSTERNIGLAGYHSPAGGNGGLTSAMILSAGVIGNKSMSASAPANWQYALDGLSWMMD